MNNVSISGKLARNGTVRESKPRVLSFVLETRVRIQDGDQQKERVAMVPCVLFNPESQIERALTEDGRGLHVEFEGRIASSSYDVRGEIRYTCEVIVRPRTLVIIPAFISAA